MLLALMCVWLSRFTSRAALTIAAISLAISAATARGPRQQPNPFEKPPGQPRDVILPEQLIADRPATLAVLDANGQLVPAVDLKLSGGGKVTTDATGRAVFTAPASPGIFTAEVTENGLTFTTIVLPEPDTSAGHSSEHSSVDVASNSKDGSPLVVFPSNVSLRDSFALEGTGFAGDVHFDRVLLGSFPALVLAASPTALVAVPDAKTATGATKLVVTVKGRSSEPASVTVVSLKVTGPDKPLAAGEKSMLTVAVDGSKERLTIEVRNFSPEIISLLHGNVQRVTTHGGELNVAKIEVEGVTPGDYSVSAHIVTGTATMTGIETARQRLLAALQFANAKWIARINTIVQRMDRDPQNVAESRRDIERLMRDRPQGQLADMLKLAWQALGAE